MFEIQKEVQDGQSIVSKTLKSRSISQTGEITEQESDHTRPQQCVSTSPRTLSCSEMFYSIYLHSLCLKSFGSSRTRQCLILPNENQISTVLLYSLTFKRVWLKILKY